jgi:choline-glycine betaine transporter
MRIFLKFMNPALWCSFASSVFVFFCFFSAYYFGNVDVKIKTAIATALSMQGIMFCVVWGLILWAMHDREKREKEYERFMHEIRQEGERFKAEMKALRSQRCSN